MAEKKKFRACYVTRYSSCSKSIWKDIFAANEKDAEILAKRYETKGYRFDYLGNSNKKDN